MNCRFIYFKSRIYKNRKFIKNMNEITVREAINRAIVECMHADNNIILIGEEVGEYNGAYKVTQGILKQFDSSRVIDTPISEAGFAGLAIGAAFAGLRPIVEFMTFNFSMQAIDQIVNSAAKTLYMSGGQIRCPIVFRGPNGIAAQVGAQHSQCFASWYSHIPGLVVIAPCTASSFYYLLKKSIMYDGPVIFLENEMLYNHKSVLELHDTYQIGKANVLLEGSDITVISFSLMLSRVLEAAEMLKNKISVEVIDLLTLRPLDKDTICKSVMKTNKVLVVEEGFPYAGICSEIISIVNDEVFDYLDHEVVRMTAKDTPLPYAKHLEKMCIPDTISIVNEIIRIYGNCNKNASFITNNAIRQNN